MLSLPTPLHFQVTFHLRRCPLAKNCMRASFNKTPTNYISVESLIDRLYEKITITAIFPIGNCQEVVRRETTEGSSIEFIGYRIPQYEQNGCTVLFTRHQSTIVCQAFLIFDWLSRNPHLKLEWLKICEMCCVNGRHMRNVLNIKISRHTLVCHYLWNVLAKFHNNPSNLHIL